MSGASTNLFDLECSSCGRSFASDLQRWRCDCGATLSLQFSPKIPSNFITLVRQRSWSWLRYREVLPIDAATAVRLGEMCTPLISLEIAGESIHVKQEQFASTGSFKDRGAFVLVSHAREIGVKRLIEDSSGNAGAAIAAYCARAGIGCSIYVPEGTGAAKTAQIAAGGALVREIPGDREKTAAAARKAAKTVWYGSHVWNPYFFQGTKLFAYEVWEQFDYTSPDTLVLPVGNGTLLLGAYIGFSELFAAGLVGRIPVIIGVQAATCNPIEREYATDRGRPEKKVPADFGTTAASGIAVADPARKREIVEAIKATNGEIVSVSEAEIDKAMATIAAAGMYVEPTGAVGFAGTAKILAIPGKNRGRIVTAFTGHGLKKLR